MYFSLSLSLARSGHGSMTPLSGLSYLGSSLKYNSQFITYNP